MGQANSIIKKKKADASQKAAPRASSDDDDVEGDIASPQRSVPRQQRRGMDDFAAGRQINCQAVLSPPNGTALQTKCRQHEQQDFGLTALRPSLDDNTCAALLALRLGRGSSVGGLVDQVPERHGSALDTMDGVPEEGSVRAGASNRGVAPEGARSGLRGSSDIRSEGSNEHLANVLLAPKRHCLPGAAAPKVPVACTVSH
ncbi:hypothetical protein Agub_g10277 [Astrephomene gubernaculifera]|uniref:Uncharacterized protein n=1 Tax=Astrephomene gubernaculifera TaxID=47775 RepID=A0AAD3DUM0_9CHLO|nr:hypothetical protein Agub_g10277 [Astrephomene gubernaculifera]